MALLAWHGGVPAGEPESRIFRMIEADRGPLQRLVAVLALQSKAAGVLVIRFVTRLALTRRGFVSLRRMTALAGDGAVCTAQWEVAPIVIETDGSPRLLVVAVLTCLPDARLVRVAGGMAGGALFRRFTMLLACIVASATASPPVRSTQWKIAEVVDERFRIESDDVGAPTPMIRVTEFARPVANSRRAAVKTLSRIEVELHPRVAGEAQPSLSHFLETFVAG